MSAAFAMHSKEPPLHVNNTDEISAMPKNGTLDAMRMLVAGRVGRTMELELAARLKTPLNEMVVCTLYPPHPERVTVC
jgi:hypothetical protein